ncbi:hypothetical protein [Bradyrhizobium sp. RT9a]|uniref:hypothetical protein n=1 Tax=Bradyrhizobium sp. RT9a TaxID=3156384 RepID=UPI0033966F59
MTHIDPTPFEIPGHLPHFDLEKIPYEDREAARTIWTNVSALSSYGQEFGAAIQLFEFALGHAQELWAMRPPQPPAGLTIEEVIEHHEKREAVLNEIMPRFKLFQQWQSMAARDGAVIIFNVIKAMDGTKSSAFACPSLRALVDRKAFAESERIMEARFPDYMSIRHAVAHAGEFLTREKERQKHSVTAGIDDGMFKIPAGAELFVGPSLNGREFMVTASGELLRYEVSQESFEHVKNAILTFRTAFHPAIHPWNFRPR